MVSNEIKIAERPVRRHEKAGWWPEGILNLENYRAVETRRNDHLQFHPTDPGELSIYRNHFLSGIPLCFSHTITCRHMFTCTLLYSRYIMTHLLALKAPADVTIVETQEFVGISDAVLRTFCQI